MARSRLEDYSIFPVGPPIAGAVSDPDCLGYVYVIGFDEPGIVKIGSALSPGTRLTELQCGNPFELKLRSAVGLYEGSPVLVEFAAHKLLADRRIRGEWFHVDATDALRAIIKAARNLKAKFGAHCVAYQQQETDHRAANENFDDDRRAQLRRKLGID